MTTDERLEKVEGQLARMRWFNRCLIACIVLSVGAWVILKTFGPEAAWAQSAVKEIRANKFVLEDESGKSRAALMVFKDGPMLVLYNENGKTRATLAATKVGPGLSLFDENGNQRVVLVVGNDGPALSLNDENDKTRAALAMGNDGPVLALNDENGKRHAELSVRKDGPGLGLFDQNDKLRAALSVNKGRPLLALFDENGDIRRVIDLNKGDLQEPGRTTKSPPSPPEGVSPPRTQRSVIASFSGTGIQNTRPFTVTGPWEIEWDAKGDIFQIYVYTETGELAGVAANQMGAGKGSSYEPKRGQFYLQVNALGPWTITIVQR